MQSSNNNYYWLANRLLVFKKQWKQQCSKNQEHGQMHCLYFLYTLLIISGDLIEIACTDNNYETKLDIFFWW